MKLAIYEPLSHRLVIGNNVIFPQTVGVFRRDTCYEIEKVGGGIELRTGGSKGLELLAAGSFAPEEKLYLQQIIESFASDKQSVRLDSREYGEMILLESALTEKAGEVGGSFRFRFGGYELGNDGGGIYEM